MNHPQHTFLIGLLSILFAWAENKKEQDTLSVDLKTKETNQVISIQQTFRATFTINGKTYTCDDVGGVGYTSDNKLNIQANKSDTDENIFFSFSLNKIGKGVQQFNTIGTEVVFTTPNQTFTNTYKPGCDDKEIYTEGTITITTLVNDTPDKDGRIEATFEGQVAYYQSVSTTPCGLKQEIVKVKGNLIGLYTKQ